MAEESRSSADKESWQEEKLNASQTSGGATRIRAVGICDK
jgi:hypothetical protein